MLKVGDKVVFDWDSAYHKANPDTTSIRELTAQYGKNTDKVFTIRKFSTDYRHCHVDGFEYEINTARLKKIRTSKWTIKPKY